MAANRFASMLHRNSNKITLILIYAVLEWILIVLLLLNSLFSYLILKFAEYFGLKPPCPWCTRIDHVFVPANGYKNMDRDCFCEFHSKEISKLGFCSNHQKLVDSGFMCEDCLSSRPEFEGLQRNFCLFGKMEGFGKFQSDDEKVGEDGEVSLNCSCCCVSLANNDKYSSYMLLKTSSWDGVLECAQKEPPIGEERDYDDNLVLLPDISADLCNNIKVLENNSERNMNPEFESPMIPEFEVNLEIIDNRTEEHGHISVTEKDKEVLEEISALIMKDKSSEVCNLVDAAVDISQHLEFFLDYSGHKLVPVELIDSVSEEQKIEEDAKIEGDDTAKDQEVCVDSEVGVEVKEAVVFESEGQNRSTFLDFDINEEPKYAMLESMDIEEDENSLVFHAKCSYLETEEFENFRVFPLAQWPLEEGSDDQEQARAERVENSDVQADNVASEEMSQGNNENEADVSIGTEIPDIDITDEIQNQNSDHTYEYPHEDSLTSSGNLHPNHDQGTKQIEEQMVDTQSLPPIIDRDQMMNNEEWVQTELKEVEEYKSPDTPTSTDSLSLERTPSLLEKGDSVAEESVDESVTSELDGPDGPVTIERLKSALRSERKALQALYTELEEERSASAVATNQTMAMINRLQEEKAAMQMEALQYQRMMEEQSEYDQEALQLLNELMVKREKEKQELEKELEIYRKKLLDYKTREKSRALGKSRDGSVRSVFSSASCSNGGDSDGLSIDLNQDVKEEEGFYENSDFANQSTPINAVVNLEESLADFEEERQAILEQLKLLEEKLLMLDDQNEQQFEDVDGIADADVNGHLNSEENGYLNDYPNGKHEKRRRIASQNGKSLLPLFDAISDENGAGMVNGNGFDSNGVHDLCELNVEMESKKLAIEEEVDHLYERLHALEADREFLKHCISSLKKGDKGMDLLQEILQHLRDLRHVEIRVKNLGDGAVI